MKDVKQILENIVKYVQGGGLAEVAARSLWLEQKGLSIPALQWSFRNKAIVLATCGNLDCRGFHAWHEVGRHVRKGEKAVWILAPMVRKAHDDEEQERIFGFKPVPVFASSQTEGEPLQYGDEKLDLRQLPLLDIAQRLGVRVEKGLAVGALGFLNPRDKVITLSSDELLVWFHELSHAIDIALEGHNPDKNFMEVVAELSGATLARAWNSEISMPDIKGYIQHYLSKSNPVSVIVQASDRVMKMLSWVASQRSPECSK